MNSTNFHKSLLINFIQMCCCDQDEPQDIDPCCGFLMAIFVAIFSVIWIISYCNAPTGVQKFLFYDAITDDPLLSVFLAYNTNNKYWPL